MYIKLHLSIHELHVAAIELRTEANIREQNLQNKN
jgi:hypothetical protein